MERIEAGEDRLDVVFMVGARRILARVDKLEPREGCDDEHLAVTRDDGAQLQLRDHALQRLVNLGGAIPGK